MGCRSSCSNGVVKMSVDGRQKVVQELRGSCEKDSSSCVFRIGVAKPKRPTQNS